jgi:KipI family sensor histidine kinase inhibitor
MTGWPRLAMAGDSALVVEFEERIDEAVNRRGQLLAAVLGAHRIAGVLDVVPAFRSVAVYFDPLATDVDHLRRTLLADAAQLHDAAVPEREGQRTHQVPVQYGGEHGPDLGAVADWAKLSEDEVIARHAGSEYQVFMLGFMPGFAYLGIVDERIAAPRLANPRVRVPAGSVAIAGRQSGIYPSDTPGGWRILGRTALNLFDIHREEPFLFAPGDVVRFIPV